MQIHGIEFEPPAAARPAETVLTFHLPPEDGDKAKVRPNLIVRSRLVPSGHTVETAAGELCAELELLGAAVADLSHGELTFADDARGVLVAYDFVRDGGVLRQYHALRVDDRRLTTLVLTVGARSSIEDQRAYVSTLGSARRASPVDQEGTP